MAAAAGFAISDGEATPVSHTFDPALINGGDGYAMFEERLGDTYIGYNRIKMWMARPNPAQQRKNIISRVQLEMPYLKEVAAGGSTTTGYTAGPEVDYRVVCDLRLTLPVACIKQERINVRALMKNFLSSSPGVALIDNYDMPY
jgi:hypothetical protein